MTRMKGRSSLRLRDSPSRYMLPWLLLWLLTISPAFGQLLAKPETLVIDDGSGIKLAMQQGNADKLLGLKTSASFRETRDFASAAYYRVMFELAKSSAYAKKCYDESTSIVETNPGPTILCGQILAGNQQIQGDMAAMARTALATIKLTYPPLNQLERGQSFKIAGFDDIDFESLSSLPAIFSSIHSGEIVLPRVFPPKGKKPSPIASDGKTDYGDDQSYFIGATIGKQQGVIGFDTGASQTLLVDASAKQVDATFLNEPAMHLGFGSNPKALMSVRPAMVDSFSTGSAPDNLQITIRHLPVLVGGRINLLGLNAIRALGSVLIMHDQVVVHPRNANACTSPLRIASQPMGQYILLISYPINHIMRSVALDTGDNSYLSGTSTADVPSNLPSLETRQSFTVTGNTVDSYYPGRVVLGPDTMARQQAIRIYPDRKEGYAYVIGTGVLRDFDVLLDFEHAHACLMAHDQHST